MVDQSKAVVPYLRKFTDEEKGLLAALLKEVAPKATNSEKALFLYTAQRKGLDPFNKQVYLVPRYTKDGLKHSVQVSIDGLRLMAQRSGKYAGQTPYQWCGPDGKWVDVWLDDENMPVAARVGVLRHDFKEPLYSVARFSDYKQTTKDGHLNHFWKTYGPHMIAKCCEALSIRRAFPEETSGFYIAEEMGNPELVYVAETEQDDSAPVVAGEVVDDQKATTEAQETSDKARATKPTPINKTDPKPENKKLEDIPSARQLFSEIDDGKVVGKSGNVYNRRDVLALVFRKDIDSSKGAITIESLMELGNELSPEYCQRLDQFLARFRQQRAA